MSTHYKRPDYAAESASNYAELARWSRWAGRWARSEDARLARYALPGNPMGSLADALTFALDYARELAVDPDGETLLIWARNGELWRIRPYAGRAASDGHKASPRLELEPLGAPLAAPRKGERLPEWVERLERSGHLAVPEL